MLKSDTLIQIKNLKFSFKILFWIVTKSSPTLVFSNQIRTFYEGSKLSQMNQDIAKSRVKYGGSEIQRDFPSDKTRRRKHFTFLAATSQLEIEK